MPNAKSELMVEIELAKSAIKCAIIIISVPHCKIDRFYELKIGYTDEELNEFMNSLDIEYIYSNGQVLHGAVWFENGNWLERIFDDDFYEYWELREFPEIPNFLK